MLKKLLVLFVAIIALSVTGAYLAFRTIKASLPQLITVKDYTPLLVSQVYDRNNKKIGEYSRERRVLVPFNKIPKNLVNAFLAAEDDQFFQHKGINYQAILRATLANIRAGRSVQGGSTITQQVAKTLLLKDTEKTFGRKFREALLAQQMEENLSKEDILYLYLNQIYFGQSAYGVELAAQTYFRKTVSKLTLPEMAILAGLPQAPSRYSPIVNPQRAKERQVYVLRRMAEVGYIEKDVAEKAIKEPVVVYVKEKYEEYAPFYLETVRQLLNAQLGEDVVLDKGLKIHTGLDLTKQLAAQEAVTKGLKDLDKRQGYRGAVNNLTNKDDIEKYLEQVKTKLIQEFTPERTILPDGKFADIVLPKAKDKLLPPYIKLGANIEGVVTNVDDNLGLVHVALPETQGLIDIETMKWARKPDTEKRYDLDLITKPSAALKEGDVILVKVIAEKFSSSRFEKLLKAKTKPIAELPDFNQFLTVELDQEPVAEAALLSFDQQTQEVIAMVGGYKFIKNKNEFNRTLQAARQTGSSFKSIVYASALDRGYTPATPLMDVPLVYEETVKDEGQEDTKVWKPSNHSKSFSGEIIFRNALVQSLNVPTVKIIEDIGVQWPVEYARRMGIFSALNNDFTLALGSSSVTLYEMTKMFSQFGRLGKRIRPLLVKKVEDANGAVLLENLNLDKRAEKELDPIEKDFEERRNVFMTLTEEQKTELIKNKKPDANFFLDDPDQLIKPTTAYVMTSLLKGVVEDKHGTAGRARALDREVAGKTGTTNGYFDAWFLGYTAQMATGVWVGFDKEKSLGKGEVGGRSALPIWVDFMKLAHEGLPQLNLPIPNGIVFANIDSDSGKLASAQSKTVIRQAFVEGTEPSAVSNKAEDEKDFLKQDLNE